MPREKQNQNLKRRGSGGSRGLLGVVTLAQLFSPPERLLLSSRQYPQKTSASSATSAFQVLVLVAASSAIKPTGNTPSAHSPPSSLPALWLGAQVPGATR